MSGHLQEDEAWGPDEPPRMRISKIAREIRSLLACKQDRKPKRTGSEGIRSTQPQQLILLQVNLLTVIRSK